MAKHTPGPWFVPKCLHGTYYVEARLRGSTLQEVAACGPTETPEQQAENARLIAASPDLLEALKRIQAYGDEWSREDTDAVDAAIAKAEGHDHG